MMPAGKKLSYTALLGHLTEEGYYDRNDLTAREANKPPIDIAVDFYFRGHLLPHGESQRAAFGPAMGFLSCFPELETPIRWITHAKVWDGPDREETLLPIPQWHV